MQKITFILSLLIIFSVQINGQKKSDFVVKIPDVKVGDSKYNSLVYIESRPNPDDMGLIYINAWNGADPVTLPSSLEAQLESLIKSISITSEEQKTLAVQMRVLFFDLGTGSQEGKGKCNLRMTLYEMDGDDNFYFLNTIDTLLLADRKKIKETASDAITAFIIGNLPYYAQEGETILNIDQVMDIDFYEKNSIPFYIEDSLPDGIYLGYKSLKNLTPDMSSDVTVTKSDEGEIKEIKIPNEEKPGKFRKLKEKDIYAIVTEGIPYISFDGDLYKAYRKDGEWVFIITQKVAGSGFSLGVSVGTSGSHGGGAVGFGIPIGGKKESIEMIIDHLNGDFYWGGKVEK